MSVVTFAQQGTFEVGGSISMDYTSVKADGYSKDSEYNVSVLPSFMYGITDQISVGASLGFEYDKYADKDKESLFSIQPTVRYTLPIVGDFSYAPQFYVGVSFGKYKFNDNDLKDPNIFGMRAGFNLVRFSYAISPKMTLAFACGDLEYDYKQYKVDSDKVKQNKFDLGINVKPTLGFYYNF